MSNAGAKQIVLQDRIDSLIERGMTLAEGNAQLYIAVAMLYAAKAVLLAADVVAAAILETKE